MSAHLGCRALSRHVLKKGVLCFILLGLVLAPGGCNPPTGGSQGGQGPGHRPQTLALSPDQEYKLGRQAYSQILERAKAENRLLSHDAQAVQRVRAVGERIAKAAQIKPLQREINLYLEGYRFDWDFNVIRDNRVNAFCLPGGKVAVFTGLLRIVENEDQLATVLSHEVAHALAHHSNERLTREESGRVNWLISKAYDRQQESEADHIGLFLMTFAGYDPDEALVFWQRMRQAARGGELPEILSTHPSDAHRLNQMRIWIPQVKAAKAAYDHGRIAPSR
jgi:metalloendopeptidase OMA1, mitochondrial